MVRYRTVGDATCTGAVAPRRRRLGDHRGDLNGQRLGARGDPRGRPVLRDRHGGPQARGLLLDATTPPYDLLRFATVGSVDDGKSTLIGRLLVDTRQFFDDQLEAVAAASVSGAWRHGPSFVTDGLRAEREQGITIDVAYRYAATPTRKFIIADCPGHVQYTRNMATGASTADLALVVRRRDAGLKEQTRRHLCIAALLGVRRSSSPRTRWTSPSGPRRLRRAWSRDVDALAARLGLRRAARRSRLGAASATTSSSRRTQAPWYDGPTVLDALEALRQAGAWERHDDPAARDCRSSGCCASPAAGAPTPAWSTATPLRPRRRRGAAARERRRRRSPRSTSRGDLDRRRDGRSRVGPGPRRRHQRRSRRPASPPRPCPLSPTSSTATICWFGDEPLTGSAIPYEAHDQGRRRLRSRTSTASSTSSARHRRVDDARYQRHRARHAADRRPARGRSHYRTNRVTGSFVLIDEAHERHGRRRHGRDARRSCS